MTIRASAMARARVERAIADCEAATGAVVDLLLGEVPQAEWPAEHAAALALALEPDNVSRGEAWKARALRRHLFGAAAPAMDGPAAGRPDPPLPADVLARRAERLRSDLARLVPLRAGICLVPPTPAAAPPATPPAARA